ncbi:MAG TPA: MFS transporter [Thermoanaerobaculia bacterium]|jgi:EmrB/QacA subfamily drug resistance transporter|nr:MFS transporter [Thermoanaerobaculia bacterium]
MTTVPINPCDEGVVLAGKPAVPCARAAEPWILAATILGSSMAFIDGTAVNVALPALQASLGATVTQVQWVVEAYALFLSALLLVGGSLGDHFGRRRVFLLGVAGFALASAWCGLAPGTGQLIAARAVQGIAAALLVPGSLALLSASFDETRRGRAIGTWSGFGSITAAVGPLVGGWLIDHASWRWVFALNLPLAVAVTVIALRFVPESRDPDASGRLDGPGALLATAGLGGVTYGLIESSRLGWSNPQVWGAIVIGAASLAAFLAVEARTAQPMMPLSLFRSRIFAGANLLTLWLYAALGGTLFFLPFNLIQVQGYSATAAGAALLPFVVLMFSLSRWSGGLVDRYGARRPLIVGPAVAAAGLALFAFAGTGGSYWRSFFPAILVLGFGMAISVAPLTTAVMGAVAERHAGVASGINNAVSRCAGLLAVAVLGIVLLGAFSRSLDRRLAGLDLPPATRQVLETGKARLAALQAPASASPEVRARVHAAVDGAFLAGYRRVMLVAAGLALLASLSAVWLIREEGPRA